MAATYSTIKQFVEKHKAFKVGGIRFQITNEHSNGLARSGGIIRLGRKILINEEKYFLWVEAQGESQ